MNFYLCSFVSFSQFNRLKLFQYNIGGFQFLLYLNHFASTKEVSNSSPCIIYIYPFISLFLISFQSIFYLMACFLPHFFFLIFFFQSPLGRILCFRITEWRENINEVWTDLNDSPYHRISRLDKLLRGPCCSRHFGGCEFALFPVLPMICQ